MGEAMDEDEDLEAIEGCLKRALWNCAAAALLLISGLGLLGWWLFYG